MYKVLKTEDEYNLALERVFEIFDAQPGTPEFDELELLGILIKDYEDKHYPVPTPDPIEAIKYKMEEAGMKNKDLIPLIGSEGHVSAVLSGKRKLTLEMARDIKDVLGVPAEIMLSGSEPSAERTSRLAGIMQQMAKRFNPLRSSRSPI